MLHPIRTQILFTTVLRILSGILLALANNACNKASPPVNVPGTPSKVPPSSSGQIPATAPRSFAFVSNPDEIIYNFSYDWNTGTIPPTSQALGTYSVPNSGMVADMAKHPTQPWIYFSTMVSQTQSSLSQLTIGQNGQLSLSSTVALRAQPGYTVIHPSGIALNEKNNAYINCTDGPFRIC